MSKSKARGRDILSEGSGKMGVDREPLNAQVYAKGRKMRPKSYHYGCVGGGGYARQITYVAKYMKKGPAPTHVPPTCPARLPTTKVRLTPQGEEVYTTWEPIRDTAPVTGVRVVLGTNVQRPKFGRNRRKDTK